MKKNIKKDMKKDMTILVPVALIALIFLLYFFNLALNYEELEKKYSCREFGCDDYAKYVGSAESNVYHGCECRYAETIKPENIVCFMSKEEAEAQGYREAEVC